ncbi:hypothetical protein MKX01_008331 [Papaver californicum]|nr:hypothetical protein MKX01_008331 [Papaver californicum]
MLKRIHGGLLLPLSLPFSSPPTLLLIKTTTCAVVNHTSHFTIDRTSCNYDYRRMQKTNIETYTVWQDEDEDDEEEQSSNDESARSEALLVTATVDGQEEEILIFKVSHMEKGITYRTSPDPSRSILPERAVIKSIDRIRGPFDPSNIEYIDKGLTLEIFERRLEQTN